MPTPDLLTLVRSVDGDDKRFHVVRAIRLDDEILYIVTPSHLDHYPDGYKVKHGFPAQVRRGMEGTTPAPHAAGTEIEYIAATIDPADWP